MIEEPLRDALGNLNQTLLGTLLFLSWVVFAFTFRWLNVIIKEKDVELKSEREAHQKTRDAQIADIRNLANVATSVDNLRSFVEIAIRQKKEPA